MNGMGAANLARTHAAMIINLHIHTLSSRASNGRVDTSV